MHDRILETVENRIKIELLTDLLKFIMVKRKGDNQKYHPSTAEGFVNARAMIRDEIIDRLEDLLGETEAINIYRNIKEHTKNDYL